MKLKTRIKMICFGMAAAIVLLSACVMLFSVRKSVRMNTELSAQAIAKQMVMLLDNVVGVMDEISLSPVLDPAIYKILLKDYNLARDRYRLYQDQNTISSQLYNDVYYRNDAIYGITYISTRSDMICYKNKSCFSPNLSNLETQPWYHALRESKQDLIIFSTAQDIMYPRSGPLLCFARVLRDAFTGQEVGVIRVDVRLADLSYLWENAKLCPETQLTVRGQEGQVIYTTDIANEVGGSAIDMGQYMVTVEQSREYGYEMTSLTPNSFVYQSLGAVIFNICLVAALCIGVTFWLSELLSDHIMEPIRNLSRCMKAVCGNNLKVRYEGRAGGEFGEVCESFNLMVDNTEKLIGRIYEEEGKKRRAEFQSLQAQISPHFLLNTLNTIRWMAVLQGNKSIAGALDDLSKMLGFTIRDTRDKISIDTELIQINHYLNILSVRYPNRFTVAFDVQPEVRDCLTLKFLLQPFLENSIFHGFDSLEREGGVQVGIHLVGNRVRYEITDNGNGIPPELLAVILTRPADSGRGMNRIGVCNVAERVKMVYGSDYFVKIESEVDRYTRVTIEIPAEYENGPEAAE